jgi:predicted PurR-regulated permease PerM
MADNVCYSCSTGGELSGTVQIKKIDKIINSNYSVLAVFTLLLIITVISFYYIFTLLYAELKTYFGFKKKSLKQDDEYYDDMIDMKYDVSNYYDANKKQFIKSVNKEYSEYNKDKSDYIRSNFNKDNDDVVNEKTLFFKKYDNYK